MKASSSRLVIPASVLSVDGVREDRDVKLLEQLLFWVHGLSSAAWFGAIFYRTLVVDSKAFTYFADRAEYERFSTHLAHGMRYFVTAGLLTCGLSGFTLAGLRWDASNVA